ncbi:hypothetical protein B296_00042930 [Ensete ventricosum]|uniref:Uncharacterized protein n=1 Tax=Ensete ventricosum TaxID=4639 RepID=A0A426WZL9_ENSVE|nr:hypothetical protein B296_00042930 [Ensete ventricosum]
MGARREFAKGWLRFGQCCQVLVLSGARRVFAGRMLEICWEFVEGNRELVENSLEVCRELTGSSPEEWWEFAEGNRELIGGSSKRCQEFTEEMIGQ